MNKVLWELVIMTIGLDTDIKEITDSGLVFKKEGYSEWLIEVPVLIYSVITMLITFNMLIAMMQNTFTVVLQNQATGWRQYQVS